MITGGYSLKSAVIHIPAYLYSGVNTNTSRRKQIDFQRSTSCTRYFEAVFIYGQHQRQLLIQHSRGMGEKTPAIHHSARTLCTSTATAVARIGRQNNRRYNCGTSPCIQLLMFYVRSTNPMQPPQQSCIPGTWCTTAYLPHRCTRPAAVTAKTS